MKTRSIMLIGPLWANGAHGAEPGIYDALVELGHRVSVWDPRKQQILIGGTDTVYHNVDPAKVPAGLKSDVPDVVLSPGAGLSDQIRTSAIWKHLRQSSVRVLWNSEPIRLGNYRGRIESNKPEFNVFCTFDESEIPLYAQLSIQAHFLPQAYNPKWYRPLNLPPSQRFPGHFCFIGSIGGKWENRVHLLNAVKQLGFSLHIATIFDAIKVNHAYNMHDGILNLGLYCQESGPPQALKAYGLQQRIFECVGAGKVCITNEIPDGTNRLFTHNENILFYNPDNLGDVLSLLLEKKHRKRIESGIMSVRDQHTYKARMKKLFGIVDRLEAK